MNSIDSSLLLLGILLDDHPIWGKLRQPDLHAEIGARSRPVFFIFIFQAIYELYRGEQDLIEDLQLARKV